MTWNYPYDHDGITNEIFVSLAKEDQWTPLSRDTMRIAYDDEEESRDFAGYHTGPLDPDKVYQFALVKHYANSNAITREETGPFRPVAPHAPENVWAYSALVASFLLAAGLVVGSLFPRKKGARQALGESPYACS